MIGIGRQARAFNVKQFLGMPDVQILAVCDVDAWRLANAKEQVEEAYAKKAPSGSYKGCDTYADFHDVLARKDIDAVMISTPDHWHVPIAMAALAAGKDVSLEKPITRSVVEGATGEPVKKHERIFRVDRDFAYCSDIVQAADVVREWAIGKVHTRTVGVPGSGRWLSAPVRHAGAAGTGLRTWQGLGTAGALYRAPGPQAAGLRAARLDAAFVLLRRHDYQLDDPLERRGHVRHRPGADRAGGN